MAIEKLYIIDHNPDDICIIRSQQSDFSGFLEMASGWHVISHESRQGISKSEICFLKGLNNWETIFCRGAHYDKDNDSLVLDKGVFRITLLSKDNRKRQFVFTGRN